jgi:CRP/FNR family cyclic AMP-dependent transcriptional regulator
MNKFRQLGFIDYSVGGDLEVHSSLLSMVLHDQPHIDGSSEKTTLM